MCQCVVSYHHDDHASDEPEWLSGLGQLTLGVMSFGWISLLETDLGLKSGFSGGGWSLWRDPPAFVVAGVVTVLGGQSLCLGGLTQHLVSMFEFSRFEGGCENTPFFYSFTVANRNAQVLVWVQLGRFRDTGRGDSSQTSVHPASTD